MSFNSAQSPHDLRCEVRATIFTAIAQPVWRVLLYKLTDVLEGAAAFSGKPDYARHILKCGILYKKYVVPAHDMKAYTQRVGAATLILSPGTRCRWVIRITLCPLYLRRLSEPQSLSRRSEGNLSYSHGLSPCGYSTPQWSLSHIVHFYETAVK